MKLSIFKNALITVFGGLMMSQAGTALADN